MISFALRVLVFFLKIKSIKRSLYGFSKFAAAAFGSYAFSVHLSIVVCTVNTHIFRIMSWH